MTHDMTHDTELRVPGYCTPVYTLLTCIFKKDLLNFFVFFNFYTMVYELVLKPLFYSSMQSAGC